MKSASAYCLGLPLLLLVLCSTGLAIQCNKCPWSSDECKKPEQCDGGRDGCMTVTRSDGSRLHDCVLYKNCNAQSVSADFGITGKISLKCCQQDLCNKGFAGLPASGLIFFLAAALLICFS